MALNLTEERVIQQAVVDYCAALYAYIADHSNLATATARHQDLLALVYGNRAADERTKVVMDELSNLMAASIDYTHAALANAGIEVTHADIFAQVVAIKRAQLGFGPTPP